MTDLPENRPEPWPEDATAEIGPYVFVRLHRDVADDPVGGAEWEKEDEQVTVKQWNDGTWSVEAVPVDRGRDFGGKAYDYYDVPNGRGEHGLKRSEAFDLAVNYMLGEAELTQPTTMALIDRREGYGDTDPQDGQAQIGRWSA